jgi:hypothetical protein
MRTVEDDDDALELALPRVLLRHELLGVEINVNVGSLQSNMIDIAMAPAA